MSAARHLSLVQHLASGQLPMFLTANEIKEHLTLGDMRMDDQAAEDAYHTRPLGTPKTKEQKAADDALMEKKHEEDYNEENFESPFHKPVRLLASVKRRGVTTPLTLNESDLSLIDGHHRLAHMLKLDPDKLLPVTVEDW